MILYLELYKISKDAYIPWQCAVKYYITNFGKQIDLWQEITNYDLIARLIKMRYIFWSLIFRVQNLLLMYSDVKYYWYSFLEEIIMEIKQYFFSLWSVLYFIFSKYPSAKISACANHPAIDMWSASIGSSN